MLGCLILKDLKWDQKLLNVFLSVMLHITKLIVFLNWIIM
jgi:hypothetical protein